jgi:hypothetical protein
VFASAALLVHLCALLHAAVLQMIGISEDMAFQCAAVATGYLSVALVRTDFVVASNFSCMLAFRENLLDHYHAFHFCRILLTLDHALVAAWQLFLHFDAAIRPARHVALELAGVKASIAFSLARCLALNLSVVKVNYVTH